jgi:opacity protein-like surface antigen
MRRSLFVPFVLGVISLSARSAEDQEGRWQEISAQGTGFFTKNSSGDGIQQHSSDTGGFVLSYRYHFTRWLAADASYGFARNTQESNTALTTLRVQANVHQATAALVVTIPRRVLKLNPYLLAGTGALDFDPTGNRGGTVAGASNQAKAVFVYGGGVDYDFSKHFFARAEYRGFVYDRPDFNLAAIHAGATTHTAQPSAGIVFRF